MPHDHADHPADENPLVSAVAHHMHLEDPDGPGPDDPPPASPGPPRDPGSGGAGFLAWLVLIAAVGITMWVQWLGPAPATVQDEMSSPGGLIMIAGRYAVGGSAAGEKLGGEIGDQLAETLEQFAVTPEDKLRAAIVRAELLGPDSAIEELDGVEAELADADAPAYAPELRTDVSELRRSLVSGVPEFSEGFYDRHGWFAKLAAVRTLDDTDPAREAVLGQGKQTFAVAVGGILGAGVLGVIGFVLSIIAVVMLARRRLRTYYRPHAPGGSVYLEVFALFLLSFLGVSYAAGAIQSSTGADYSRYLIWLLVLVPFWARLRGADRAMFKDAMGWHTGRGVFREIGAGVVGYVTCLPIFALGIGATLILAAIVSLFQSGDAPSAPPTHPILNEIQAGNVWAMLGVYLVASVWAPFVEESLFRGALFHHLRGRLHPLLAALAVGFVFAAIHPQGLIAIPALMSLGVVFCLLREWRGSLIAPMTAHALHNGTLMTAMILALS